MSSTTPPLVQIPADFAAWLDAHAESLDTEARFASDVLPGLAKAGLLGIGVPTTQPGGYGGSIVDAIEAIAQVTTHSLTAAFVLWGHRVFIEYVLQSPNAQLRSTWLTRLLRGEIAGATGLSNAMKYLSALESLQVRARALGPQRWVLSGRLPWITNLRSEGFLAAAAFERADGAPCIFAVPHDLRGITRSKDLDLIALRASNTAALQIDEAEIDERWLLADDAGAFLTLVRPAFVGLQCGMAIGLARRALTSVEHAHPVTRATLAGTATQVADTLAQLTSALFSGIATHRYVEDVPALFQLRIDLADVAARAIHLDISASGGQGYLRGHGGGVARRVREASFNAIVTPSIVQLKHQLALHAGTS